MKKISFTTLKGGVGKTFFTFNIAGFLAKLGKKVLCVDCDPQGNITSNFGLDDEVDDLYTIANIFSAFMVKEEIKMLQEDTSGAYDDTLKQLMSRREVTPEEIVIKSPIEDIPNIDLFPSDIELTAMEWSLYNYVDKEKAFDNYIERYKEFFEQYDYILFDLSPSLSIINQSALYTSDDVILVSDIGRNSYKGVRLLIREWVKLCDQYNIEVNITGIVLNKYDQRENLSKDFITFMEKISEFKDITYKTKIPKNVRLGETEMVRRPISYYNVDNKGYEAFEELMNELQKEGVI